MDVWRVSGLIQAEYLRQYGLGTKSLSYWARRKRSEETSTAVKNNPRSGKT